MKLLIDDVRLNLLLEQKKKFIGKEVIWDSLLSALSFLVSVCLASYGNKWGIPGHTFKIAFIVIGLFFTFKAVKDIHYGLHNSYNYEDLLKDINSLNEITHDHSIVAIRDSFNEYPNRFLVYDDTVWGCMLFLNYKDSPNNEMYIKNHVSRELKIDDSNIKIEYIAQNISEKKSARNGESKVYCHKLFLITIDEFPSHIKKDSFECDGKIYHWKSINDLENDAVTMGKNSDIIRFVKEKI